MSNVKSFIHRRRLDEMEVGEVVVTGGITITDAHIATFAGLVGDFYPWHSDDRLAKESPFGARIAHATLTLSIATGLQMQYDPIDALAFIGIEDCTFSAPVKLGDTIYVRSTLLSTRRSQSKPGLGIAEHRRDILNQDDEVVGSFVTKLMVNVGASGLQQD